MDVQGASVVGSAGVEDEAGEKSAPRPGDQKEMEGPIAPAGAGDEGKTAKRRRSSVRKPRTKGIVKKLQDQVKHVNCTLVLRF